MIAFSWPTIPRPRERCSVGILSSAPGIVVVGEARDGLEAVTLTQRLKPSLVTMDLHMPRMDGFAATKEIMVHRADANRHCHGKQQAAEVATAIRGSTPGRWRFSRSRPAPGARGFEEARQKLCPRWRRWRMSRWSAIGACRPPRLWQALPVAGAPHRVVRARVVAIAHVYRRPGSVTGSLSALPGDFSVPILVVQHITRGFNQRLAAG